MAPRKRRAKPSDDIAINPFDVMDGAIRIELPDEDGAGELAVDPNSGNLHIENADGTVDVSLDGSPLKDEIDTSDIEHDTNLADKIDESELSRITEELLDAISADKGERSQWEQMRAKTVELLGLKLEDPKNNVSTSSSGMSTSVVRDPSLLEAVERFRANAYAELCPASGPVKVVDWGSETASSDDLANALQKDLNFYLTTTASEYYPDTRYMLWWTGLASGTFKKVYKCPLRRRPVSEYVDGTNLIVPSNATDLKNAGRVTHEIMMRRSVMKRMQIAGVYRDVSLSDPMQAVLSAVDNKVANVEGKAAQPQRIEDQEYTVYECYCELDIKGFEHEEDGEVTGLPLPYKVTIEEGSRQILEVRKNWEDDDEDKLAQIPFVLFPYSTGLSRIYGSGLGQMMGNMVSALTALLRINIDAGMNSNYPGLLKAKGAGRQLTNEIIVPPGGCQEIDTGGLPIQQAIMGMPYKDVSAGSVGLMGALREVTQRLGGTADLPVGEGKQDAPVGTTMALIEQATKVEGSVHKALHAAQSEEFRLLLKLFKDDPEALWRGNRRPAMGTGADKAAKDARIAKFMKALENCDIVPMADPNVPSDMHRALKAQALKQLASPGGMANPLYNQIAVDRRIAAVYKIDDFDALLAPQQPQQPNPLEMAAMAKLQIEGQKVQIAQQKVQIDAHNAEEDRKLRESTEAAKLAVQHANANRPEAAQQVDPLQSRALDLKHMQIKQGDAKLAIDARNANLDRQSKESVEAMKIAQAIAVHPKSDALVDEQLQQMSAFLTPMKSAGGMANGGSVDDDDDAKPKVTLADIDAALKKYLEAFNPSVSH